MKSTDTGASEETSAAADGLAEPPILTAQELAAFLRVDRKTVYEAAARGDIPGAVRLGRVLRFSRAAVLAWARDGLRPPRASRR